MENFVVRQIRHRVRAMLAYTMNREHNANILHVLSVGMICFHALAKIVYGKYYYIVKDMMFSVYSCTIRVPCLYTHWRKPKPNGKTISHYVQLMCSAIQTRRFMRLDLAIILQ